MFFQLKPGKKHPRVVVYDFKDGKQVPLPRRLTKHLDGKPEPEIEDWIRWYAAVNSIQLRRHKLDLGDLEKPLRAFLDSLKDKGRHQKTVDGYEYFIRFAMPTFKDEPSPNGWYLLGGKLTKDLRDAGLSASQRSRTNQAFQAFYRWLQGQGIVQHRHGFILDKIDLGRRETPLKRLLTPDEVLLYARGIIAPELRFVALAGYFLSLRPSEVFGARKQDFLAGSEAMGFEAAKVMRSSNLFDGLVYSVRNCRRPSGVQFKPSKRKPGGIVACFNGIAAGAIAELVDAVSGPLIISTFKPDYWAKRWSKEGIPGITLKDLRRASLYWLGHYSNLTFNGLRNHARHTNYDTTLLYTRRPEEKFTA